MHSKGSFLYLKSVDFKVNHIHKVADQLAIEVFHSKTKIIVGCMGLIGSG